MKSETGKVKSLAVSVLLMLGTLVMAAPPQGEEQAQAQDWPGDGDWMDYMFRGEPVRDWEDKPYENDPTHGPANVQPAAVDIASGVDASGGGPENNPGDYTSVQYLYEDVDGDSSGCDNLEDDWIFLRMRVADDPRQKGGNAYYKAYHWDVLFETDGDIWSEFVVDLNGGDGKFKWGTVGVYYNNTEDYEYDPDEDGVWLQEASKDYNDYTQAVEIDYDNEDESDDQWWIEYRIPVSAFDDYEGNQLLCYDTDFLLFFSTSASMTNPLQKDWMGEYVFGEPANITVVKTVVEDIVTPGDTIHYEIFYNNTGDYNASNVWINDTIPDYTTYLESSSPYDSVDGSTYGWHFTDIAPGNYTLYLNVTVDLDAPDGEVLNNVAVLNYTDHNDGEQPGSEDETETTVDKPIMTFAKEADVTTADPGDVIQYTLTYENTGSGGAYNVVIEDTIPDYTTFQSSTPTYDSVSGKTYTWVITYVPGYYSDVILIYIMVNAYTPDGTYLVNHATLDYEDENGNEYDGLEDWAYVTVTAPIVTLSKTADVIEADPGDQITYTIEYENIGTGDATGIVIVDTIDPDTTLISADPEPDSEVGDVLTWNLGTLAGGASGSITIIVEVDSYVADGTILTNSVTLNYNDANDNPYDELSDSVDVTCTAPMMMISKTADKTEADPGDQITYTIYYENTGTGAATDVVIVDTIDPDTTYISATPAPDSVVGDVLTWNIGTVAGGASDSITVIVEVDAGVADGTILTNTVVLNYDDANGNAQDEESDSVDVTVTAPVMSFSKSADVSYADPGDTIVYTLYYENTGSGDATLVVVEDTIPSDVTFVSSNPGYDGVSGNTYTWNVGIVAGYSSGTITITVTVNVGVDDGTLLHNTATLDYADANGNYYDQLDDYADVTVTAPIMTFNKSADVTEADPGDTIVYTLSYENTGSGDATLVVVEDTIPADVTYVSSNPGYDGVSGNTYTWNVGTVAGYSSGTITITVTVNVGVDDGTVLHNTATLDYADANGNYYAQLEDYADVTVTAPIMTFSKSADVTTADPGDTIVYTLYYENTGSGDATLVVVEDTIPSDVTYVSSNPGYDGVSGNTYTWNVGTVAGYSSGTITITVTVNVGVDDGTVLHNTATLDYADANGNYYTQLDDYADVTVTAPIMTFSKSADVTTADPGDTIVYTLDYENTGSGDATLVVVEDTIPSDVTYVSSNPGYDGMSGNTYTWNVGTVAGYSSGTITITVTVNVGVDDGTLLHNTATLDYADANGNYYTQLDDYADVTVTAPIMTFSKSADVTTADPGDTIIYTLYYENTGSGDATLVVVEDTIPSDVTYVSSNPGYDGVSGNTYTWNVGTVAGYSSGTITITVTVNVGVDDGTVLHNTATLDYADANGNYYTQLDDYADVTVTAPIMTFSKSADVTTADPGDTIVYTLDYENTGSGDATLVVVKDTIPSDVTFVSSNPPYDSISGNMYSWNIGTVAGYSSGTITITVTVNVGVDDGTLLHNTATLDYADANGNYYDQLDDYADVTVTAPIMTFSKSADVTTADPGDTIVYTLSYENTGSGDATLVVVEDTIPSDVTYVSSNPGYDGVSGNTYTWNVGTVAGYSSGTITITVTVNVGVDDGTLLHNTATLDYADANGNYYDQLDDYADVTVMAPIMTFSKSADVTEADPGDTIVYTLDYENTGSGDATLVVVKDTIPAGVTYVSSSPSYDSVSGRTYTWNVGTVSGYSSGTITITVTVNISAGDGSVLHNTATLDYADANGNYYDQLDDYADVTVTSPEMIFIKSADVTKADPGDTIVYTLYYENTGSGDATLVVVKDTIPVDVTYISSSPSYDSVSGRTYTWNVGTVSGYSSGTITITVTVNVSVDDGTVLHNVATLDYADANGNYYDQLEDSADVTVTAPVMSFSKSADVTEADPGDTIVYTLYYENTGSGDATLVVVKDTIPSDVTFVSSSPLYDGMDGNTYTWNVGTVSGYSSGTITITVTVNVGVDDGTVLHNTAILDYADANGNYYDQLDDYADVTVTAPVMSFSKSADVTEADPGDTIVYTLYYENSGSGDATLVVVEDTIPSDVTYVSSSPTYNGVSGNTYTWNVGTVGAYSSGTITITVTVNVGVDDGTLLHNTATLDYADANGNYYDQLDDYADVTVTAPVMSFSKSADVTEADPGDTIVYTLYYENSGSGDATLVVVKDTIPADVTYVSSSPAYDGVSGNTYTWNVGTVGAYSNGTITITVTVNVGVDDGTVLHNTATLDYADANGNYYDQLDDYADVTVTAPILSITKTADVSTADPEDQVTYTIEFENSGSGNATNVWINDTIPADTTLISTSPDYNYSSGDTYTWFFALIEAGTSVTITIIVEVDVGTPDETNLHNEVTLDYSDANGNPLDQESAFADVTVTAPILHVTKTADVSYADPGDTIVYTIEYWNSGTGWATLVEIVDTIPADTTYVSSNPGYDSVSGDAYTWDIGDVAPSGSGTITITVTVDVGTPDETLLHNVVTLDYADANGNYYTQLDDYADVTVTAPILHVTKTADVSYADPGDTIVYTIEYWNSGTGWATLVEIIDTIPADTTYVSSNPGYDSVSGDAYTWDIGDVAPGGSGTITITVTVDVATSDETLLHNVVTLDYADANGNYYTQLDDYADVTVTAPILHVTKTADVSYADPGDTIVYTIEYWNSGTGWATLVEIVDTIPADTTYASSNPGYDSVSGDAYTWDIGDVAPGGSGTITITVTVDVATPDETLLHNVVTLDYADANGNYYDQLDDYADVTVTAPVISFTKVANMDYADPGTTITYTITYTNLGTGYAHNVVIEDTIPSDTTFEDSNPTPTYQIGRTYTWEIGVLPPGTTGYIYIYVTVIVGTPDMTILYNGATFDYSDPNDNYYPQLNGYAEVTVTAPVLTMTKTADVSYADPGDTIVYTIEYENTGTGWASLVEIVDTIPADTTYVSSNPGYDSVSGDQYTWNVGDVAPGGSGTITITVTVDAGTPDETILHNVATLDYADANGNYYPQLSDYANVTVTAPILSITKTADVSYADPGDTIVYTIEYENTGTGWASLVEIVDTIPADTTYVSSNPGYDSVSGDEYTWFIGDVSPGGSGTITITVTVDVGTPDQTVLHNVATLDYADANGNYYPQLDDYADVTVTAPVLTITKTADVSTANPGDTIVYTIEIENTGTGWASLVEIVDIIPANTVLVSSSPPYLGGVAPSSIGTVTVTVTVNPYTPDETLLHNVALLDYADANGNYYPQLSDHADVTVTAPILHVTKSADVSEADPGDPIVYTINYWNSGTGWASLVEIVDTIPADTTFVSSNPTYDSVSGDEYTWIVGDLATGDSGTITITVTVDAGVSDETCLHNVVTLDYADTNGNYYPQLSDYADVVVTAPIMTVSKTADVPEADPGDTIVYTIEYENIGTGDASDVVIVDTLPADVTFVTASLAPDSIVGKTLTWNIGVVSASSSGSITVTVTVNPGTWDLTVLHNVVTLNYSDANGNFIEQVSDYADVTVTAPIMTLDKEAEEVTVEAYVVADIRLRVAGEKWHNVILTLYDGSGSFAVAEITRYPGDPDDQAVTLYNVTIPLMNGPITAIVLYTPEDDAINGQWWGANPCWLILMYEDGTEDRLKHTFNVRHEETWNWTIDDFRPYLKKAPITYEATIMYLITYANVGTGGATNVVITDTFPTGFTFVNSSIPYGSCSADECTWNIDDVPSGANGYIFLNITIVGSSSKVEGLVVINEVTLDYSDANGNYFGTVHAISNITISPPDIDFGTPIDTGYHDPGMGLYSGYSVSSTTSVNTGSLSLVSIPPSESTQNIEKDRTVFISLPEPKRVTVLDWMVPDTVTSEMSITVTTQEQEITDSATEEMVTDTSVNADEAQVADAVEAEEAQVNESTEQPETESQGQTTTSDFMVAGTPTAHLIVNITSMILAAIIIVLCALAVAIFINDRVRTRKRS